MKNNTKFKLTTKSDPPLFVIEKGIPVASRKKPNPYESVFSQMKNGDSFLVGDDDAVISRVAYHAGKWGRDNAATFAFRLTDEGKRCWRIK